MSGAGRSLQTVLSALAEEGHLPANWPGQAQEALAQLEDQQPWYVRTMVGVGAWLASLLLLSFIGGVSLLTSEAGFIVTGALLMLGAVVLRRQVNNDFFNQAALAISLAGQALLAFGVAETVSGRELEAVLYSLILANGVLIVAYPDPTHRFLSVVFMVSACVGLLYFWRSQWFLAYLAPLLATGYVVLLHEGRSAVRTLDAVTRPVMAGLMFSAFGVVMLSTLYVFPELVGDFQFYPNPWISTLLFGVLLLYAAWKVLAGAPVSVAKGVMPAIYGLSVLTVLVALQAPGLVYGLLVILLGTGMGHRVMTGVGLVFLVVFVGAYFYGIDISLLMKSLTLLATGVVLLVGRWGLLAVWPERDNA